MDTSAHQFAHDIWTSLGGDPALPSAVSFVGTGDLPSAFAVSDLAAGSIAAAGLAVAELVAAQGGGLPRVRVDRRLASFWFGMTMQPLGWSRAPAWDPIAGDYATSDGWIRLHTNAPHHRDAALAVLRVPTEKAAVTAAVARWKADDLEAAVLQQGGCAAVMRGLAEWAAHPHGSAVASEPLAWMDVASNASPGDWQAARERPLAGIRVLDQTRVLAGPVATRFLAGFGADVLRIDPPGWDEPGVVPDVTLGKRCARLDLRDSGDRRIYDVLLASADMHVHGYRPDALSRLGLDADTRQLMRPGLIDVSLDAYGWTGPWRGRRGFDSLLQMSSGIAAEGMRVFGARKPTPLPVQALDQATGYIMAAAAVRGLTRRLASGTGSITKTSLARTATLLTSAPRPEQTQVLGDAADGDYAAGREQTSWGPARRLTAPVSLDGAAMRWDRGAISLGSSEPVWLQR